MRGEGRRLLGRSNFIASASPAIKSARRVSGRRSSVSTERYIRFPPFEEATPATLPKWRGPDGSVEGGPGTPALAALPHPQEKSFDPIIDLVAPNARSGARSGSYSLQGGARGTSGALAPPPKRPLPG